MTGCPHRRAEPDGSAPAAGRPAVERVGGPDDERWVVRSFDAARQVLRDPEASVQAGFGAELMGTQRRGDRPGARGAPAMRPPILYLEGAAHRAQRRAAARYFAPAVVEGYRPMVREVSEWLVGRLRADRSVDLSVLAMRLAVEVAAQVVGLTASSRAGMSGRLGTFFAHDPLHPDRGLRGRLGSLLAGTAVARFYWLDVKPAIRARRRRPADDVVSQLLADGFSDLEILTECLTYGAAGMATTRELVQMAVWHLLDDAGLRERWDSADRRDRLALLEEVLRLEPVVGHLYRRLVRPLEVSVNGTEHRLPAGALVDLDVRAGSADPAVVGEAPDTLCPGRPLPRGVPGSVLGFGDGHHRCPGGPLALMETEVFLSVLLADGLVADGPPRLRWNPVSQGYELDRFRVRRPSPTGPAHPAAGPAPVRPAAGPAAPATPPARPEESAR